MWRVYEQVKARDKRPAKRAVAVETRASGKRVALAAILHASSSTLVDNPIAPWSTGPGHAIQNIDSMSAKTPFSFKISDSELGSLLGHRESISRVQ